MTQYLLAVHHRDGYPVPGPDDPDEDLQEVFAAVDRFNARLTDAGALVFAGGLVPPSEAKVADGSTVTDGPFSEAKEVLGGFLGRRGGVARRGPGARPRCVDRLRQPGGGAGLPVSLNRARGQRAAAAFCDRAVASRSSVSRTAVSSPPGTCSRSS